MTTGLLTTDVRRAVEVLTSGGLVALPTETVYGLGADARNASAVARVYAVKGRPADHPLIVHVASVEAAAAWSEAVPDYALRLAAQCWPGPMTLVLRRSRLAGDHVTGGQDSVGIRIPDHAVTLSVIEALGPEAGVAAPSANRFGAVSPTTAGHVVDELGGLLIPGHDLVLDGGPCLVGLESTIIDARGEAPVVLRPGALSSTQIAEIGGVSVVARSSDSAVRAPGTLASHYAPAARVVLVNADAIPESRGSSTSVSTGLLALASIPTPTGVVRLSAPTDAAEFGVVLYSALREADALGLTQVWAVPPTDTDGIGAAVRDRLVRASA